MSSKVPTIISADDLPRGAKQRANRAIENVHLAYYEEGGIRDTHTKLQAQTESAADHIYRLATYASEQGKTLGHAAAMFLGMCAYAEQRYKEVHEVTNLKEVLPVWTVYKSNILKGIREIGLDPQQYRSEAAFRLAWQEQQREAQQVQGPLAPEPPTLPAEPAAPPEATAREGPEVESQEDIDRRLAQTIVHDGLRRLLAQIVFEVECLKSGNVRKAQKILRETMNRLQPLVDPAKIED